MSVEFQVLSFDLTVIDAGSGATAQTKQHNRLIDQKLANGSICLMPTTDI